MAGTRPWSAEWILSRWLMELSVTFSGLTEMLDRIGASERIVNEEKTNMAYEVGEIAADAMRGKIEREGTAFSRAAQRVGLNRGPGRIRSGQLYDSIDYEVDDVDGDLQTTVGYLNDYEPYFEAQEVGFYTRWKGSYDRQGRLRLEKDGTPRVYYSDEERKVKGMFLLRAARREVNQEASRLLKKYRSRITKRINGTI